MSAIQLKPSKPVKNVHLETCLDPIRHFLSDDQINEICINAPGAVWIERAGAHEMTYHDIPAMCADTVSRIARLVAGETDQSVNKETPLLSASLPGGSRVQIVLPPAARFGPALSIRKAIVRDMSLDDYSKSQAFTHIKSDIRGDDDVDMQLRTLRKHGNIRDFLAFAVLHKKNILISGGTSSGKTTFFNALLKEIPDSERIITIEDTPEIRPPHANHLSLLASKGGQSVANITIQSLLEASLRLRPDRLLLGELRGHEAYSFLRAVNTGHPGSMTTIHADTPKGAIDQLAFMVMQANLGLKQDEIKAYVRSVIDVVVQLRRVGGRRIIDDVWCPKWI